jgi:hypothetical protein
VSQPGKLVALTRHLICQAARCDGATSPTSLRCWACEPLSTPTPTFIGLGYHLVVHSLQVGPVVHSLAWCPGGPCTVGEGCRDWPRLHTSAGRRDATTAAHMERRGSQNLTLAVLSDKLHWQRQAIKLLDHETAEVAADPDPDPAPSYSTPAPTVISLTMPTLSWLSRNATRCWHSCGGNSANSNSP